MTHPPPETYTYSCPIHVENLLPKERLRRRYHEANKPFILRPQLPPSYYAALNADAIEGGSTSADEQTIRTSNTANNGKSSIKFTLSKNAVELASSAIPTAVSNLVIEVDPYRPPQRHVVSETFIKLDFFNGAPKLRQEFASDAAAKGKKRQPIKVPQTVVDAYQTARQPLRAAEDEVKVFLGGLVAFLEEASVKAVHERRACQEQTLRELTSAEDELGRCLSSLPLRDLRRLAKGEPVSEVGDLLLKESAQAASLQRTQPAMLRFAAWSWYQQLKSRLLSQKEEKTNGLSPFSSSFMDHPATETSTSPEMSSSAPVDYGDDDFMSS